MADKSLTLREASHRAAPRWRAEALREADRGDPCHATAQFSKGTSEAACATGAAPITLIDGDKLIDLLIEHGIGVKRNKIEVLSVDADAFADLEADA